MTEPIEATDPDTQYPDVEIALCEYLKPLARTVTQLMTMDNWPAIRIQRVAGGETETGDDARVRVTAYAKPDQEHPRASQDLARQIVLAMREITDSGGKYVAFTMLERADKESGPVSYPFDDPEIRATDLIYRVPVRDL